MIAAASQKKAQYDYLILSFALSDTEIPVWESLFWQNKAVLSANIYSMIANEMPALEEAASRRQPRSGQKTYFRRLFLLPLPEYRHVISFVRLNIRRPAFKEHLKKLILYNNERFDRIISDLVRNSIPEGTTIPESAQHISVPPDAVMEKAFRRSPRELFADPHALITTIVRDLRKPETERLFTWDEIPPEDYPEAVRRAVPFGRLTDFWNASKKAT